MQPGAKRWIFRLATATIATLLCLFVAEGLVRFFYPVDLTVIHSEHVRLSENPRLMYELDPDYEGHNSLGFRGDEFSVAKDDGLYRILTLGDSLTYGNGVEFEDSYPQQLEVLLNTSEEFRRRRERVEVLNLGVPGYSILQELEQLRTVGLRFKPDLVILVVCLNDGVPHTVEFDQLLATRQNQAIGFLSSFYDPSNSWMRRALYRSHLVRLISFKLHQTRITRTRSEWTEIVETAGELPKVKDTSVRTFYDERAFFEHNFKELSGELRRAGVPLIVALVPAKGIRHRRWYQRYLGMMTRLIDETADPFIDFLKDLNEAYDGDPSLYEEVFLPDDLFHLNPRGGAMLAESLGIAVDRVRGADSSARENDYAPDGH